MISLLALVVAATATDPAMTEGTIQVGRGVSEPTVWLIQKSDGVSLRLAGEPVVELRALQSATVALLGIAEQGRFVVTDYRLVSLPGGKRPTAVGIVRQGDDGTLVLGVEVGPPMALSAAPKLQVALVDLVGSKVWVTGQQLLSGALKVSRFGVLRPKPQEEPSVLGGDELGLHGVLPDNAKQNAKEQQQPVAP